MYCEVTVDGLQNLDFRLLGRVEDLGLFGNSWLDDVCFYDEG